MGQAGDVGRFTVLKNQPRSDQAEQLLRKVHSMVKPLMKRHDWFLPTLSEFYPRQPNLLGVNINRGFKICLRLRPAGDPSSFYDLDSIIGTMLHELMHNVRGPHDDVFWKELGKLRDDFDALVSKGYEGEGFYGRGTRVGIGTSHDIVDDAKMRAQRLATLERKLAVQKVLGKGGKLGGSTEGNRGKTRSEILAEAAEKRKRERESCGAGANSAHDGEVPAEVLREIQAAEQASRDAGSTSQATRTSRGSKDENTAPTPKAPTASSSESDEYDDDVIIVAVTKRAEDSLGSSRPSGSSSKRQATRATATSSTMTRQPTVKTWSCDACTFANTDMLSLSCAVCLSLRTGPFEDAWACECLTLTENDFWTCRKCGRMKTKS